MILRCLGCNRIVNPDSSKYKTPEWCEEDCRTYTNSIEYQQVPMWQVVDQLARVLMKHLCVFDGVSGDYDRCVSTTRNTYQKMACENLGITWEQWCRDTENL